MATGRASETVIGIMIAITTAGSQAEVMHDDGIRLGRRIEGTRGGPGHACPIGIGVLDGGRDVPGRGDRQLNDIGSRRTHAAACAGNIATGRQRLFDFIGQGTRGDRDRPRDTARRHGGTIAALEWTTATTHGLGSGTGGRTGCQIEAIASQDILGARDGLAARIHGLEPDGDLAGEPRGSIDAMS